MTRRWSCSVLAIGIVLGGVIACDDGDGSGGDTASAAACEDSDEPAQLLIQNRTGSTISTITMRACDGSDLADTPIDGGLPPGIDTTIPLPSPGCWILSYAGDSCFNDPKHQTSAQGVCGGETHTWLAGSDTHSCAGGGW